MAERIERDVRVDETIVVRPDDDADRADTAAIHAEIRETRERMGHTLEDISERLNPDHIKDQVKHNIREATIGRAEDMARNAADRVTETRHSIMDTIRDNPLPAAMVGAGLGWLFWNGRKEDSYSRGGPYADINVARRPSPAGEDWYARSTYDDEPGVMERASGRAQHAVTDLAGRTQEAASGVADRARSAAGHIAEETRYRTHRVEDRFQGALQETPLALGAAAVALGLAAGLSAPATRKESEFMGGARDQLVERAREVAGETTEKVQRVAERAMDEAQTTAGEAAREQGLATSDPGGGPRL